MGIQKSEVHARVANVVGVPSATPPSKHIAVTATPPIIERAPKRRKLKRVLITKEHGDLTRTGYMYRAMTNLGDKASQLKYAVMLRGRKGAEKPQKVVNMQTTPEGEISCMIPELVHVVSPSKIQKSKESLPHYHSIGSRVYIKWEEQQIGDDTYAKGQSHGVILRTGMRPKQILPKLPIKVPAVPPVKSKLPATPLVTVPTPTAPITPTPKEPILRKHVRETRMVKPKRELAIAKRKMRKVSTRAEELMEKRAFPKAVKEAIEKGLERKEAPRDIERIIAKVAKTNEPNYILRRTIAKRLSREGIVQYKVDTDKGTIIYENADENTVNAILGMPTPTGEVIPLQIKVIR